MPSFVVSDAKVWLAQWDVSGHLRSVAIENAIDLKDATTLGQTGRIRRSGLRSTAMQVEGFVDLTVQDPVYQTAFGVVDVPVSVSPGARDGIAGGEEGAIAYMFRALHGDYQLGGVVGELAAFSAGAQSSDGGPLVTGTVMHAALRTTTGTGTARNLGAVSASQKVYAALHILAATGTLNVTVQSDALVGFGSPATVITFAPATGQISEWATPVPGPLTDAWWRINWTVSGGGSFYFVVTVGIL